jgi:DNA repair protein RadC
VCEPGALARFLRRIRHRSGDCDPLPLHEDADVVRFLHRLGVVSSVRASARAEGEIERFVEAAARTGAAEPAVSSVLLRGFACGIYGVAPEPVCGDAPRCDRCPLSHACRERSAPDARGGLGVGESPTERVLLEGVASLTAEELMTVVASPSRARERKTYASCERLLRDHGGLRGVAGLDACDLEPLLGKRGAAALIASSELARRWASAPRSTNVVFVTGADIFNRYRVALRDLKKEVFIALALDQRNAFIADEWCSQGTLTASLVHPREAFRLAVRESAAAIAFVHNHPSGNPQPSAQDRELTERLVEVARIVGIRFVDHVIAGDATYVSFRESGWV